jgi:hypothetical protein
LSFSFRRFQSDIYEDNTINSLAVQRGVIINQPILLQVIHHHPVQLSYLTNDSAKGSQFTNQAKSIPEDVLTAGIFLCAHDKG